MIKTEVQRGLCKSGRTNSLLKQGQDPAFIARAMGMSKKEVMKRKRLMNRIF